MAVEFDRKVYRRGDDFIERVWRLVEGFSWVCSRELVIYIYEEIIT